MNPGNARFTSSRYRTAVGVALVLAAAPSWAKRPAKAPAAAPIKQASEQTKRAISELMGKFKWDMSHEDAMKIVAEEIAAKYDERIQKEQIPAKQDKILKEKNDSLDKMRASYAQFDGQKTGWDVSIIDKEFGHKNDESMFVIWEKDQRRFLFFHQDKLWKQFIAFNAENPVFKDKTFDDFGEIIQRRYGPAAMTFRKQRTNDEQVLDHLEWPPSGDYVLWAIDLTNFYGNFCLSLMQRSKIAGIEKSREENSPRQRGGSGVIDSVTKGDANGNDINANIVDEITGRATNPVSGDTRPSPVATKKGKKGEAARGPEKKATPSSSASEDPLHGTDF